MILLRRVKKLAFTQSSKAAGSLFQFLAAGVAYVRLTMASASDFSSAGEIPVDFTVRKGFPGLIVGDLTLHDAEGNLSFRVHSQLFSSSSSRVKTLLDAAGNILITCVNRQGDWEAFRGNSLASKDVIFAAQKTISSSFGVELRVFMKNGSSDFIVRGSPFQRSCTIYRDNSIIAQANPNFKLGKVIYSRHKFRLTVYPGIDHALVVAILVVYFDRR